MFYHNGMGNHSRIRPFPQSKYFVSLQCMALSITTSYHLGVPEVRDCVFRAACLLALPAQGMDSRRLSQDVIQRDTFEKERRGNNSRRRTTGSEADQTPPCVFSMRRGK